MCAQVQAQVIRPGNFDSLSHLLVPTLTVLFKELGSSCESLAGLELRSAYLCLLGSRMKGHLTTLSLYLTKLDVVAHSLSIYGNNCV